MEERLLRALEACETVLENMPEKYQSKEYKYALQNTKKVINDYYRLKGMQS